MSVQERFVEHGRHAFMKSIDVAKQQIEGIPDLILTHLPIFVRGFYLAISTLLSNMSHNTYVNQRYWKFIKEAYLPIVISFYSIFVAIAFFFFPITVATILFAPGILWQFLTIVPIWSLHVATKKHPINHGLLFIEGIREVDPNLAREFENKMQRANIPQRTWFQAIQESFDDRVYFWTWSVICLFLNLIPVVGTITTGVLQTWVVSQKLASRLLDTYTNHVEGMSHHQEHRFINRHWSLLLGFCLPYVLISSIPFIGPLSLVYAEIGAAKLFYYAIYKKEGLHYSQTGRA